MVDVLAKRATGWALGEEMGNKPVNAPDPDWAVGNARRRVHEAVMLA